MDSATEIREFNQGFVDSLNEDLEKTAQDVTDTLAEQILEGSFRDVIIVPDTNPRRIQISLVNDTFYVVDYIRPTWTALDLNLDGDPTGEYLRTRKFATPFAKIETPVYRKKLDELLEVDISLEDLFKEDLAYYIAERQDRKFIAQTEVAAAAYTNILPITAANVLREDLLDGINLIERWPLKCTQILLHQTMLNNLMKWDDFDIGAWEVIREGWKSGTILGRKLIVTLKEWFNPNRIYFYTDQQLLGKNYTHPQGDVKFMIKKDLDNLEMVAKKLTGCGIQNTKACAYLDFTYEGAE